MNHHVLAVKSVFIGAQFIMCCFFALSGFLVFRSARELSEKHSNWKLKFFTRRFFRIFPLWWLILFFYFLYPGLKLDQLLINFSFLFGFVSFNEYYLPIGPAWSLFVEECFYLTLPIILFLLKSFKNSLIIFIVLCLVRIIWFYLAFHLQLPNENYFIQRFPLSYFSFFALGIIFSFLYEKKIGTQIHLRSWVLLLIEILTIALSFSNAIYLPGAQVIITALLLCFTLLRRGILHKLFSVPFLQWCGRRCYYIYISHTLVINWSISLNEKFFNLPHYEKYASFLELAFILLTANFVWKYFEKPFIVFSRRL